MICFGVSGCNDSVSAFGPGLLGFGSFVDFIEN